MHPLTAEFFANVPRIAAKKALPSRSYRYAGYPLLANWDRLIRAHDALADEESREIFRRSVTFRLLKWFLPVEELYDSYPLIAPETWKSFEEAAKALPEMDGSTIDDLVESRIIKAYEHPCCQARPGDVFLDVGAFTGSTAIYFADKVQGAGESGGKVYSFEPAPDTFAKLEKNVAALPNVVCVHSGVGDAVGTAFLSGAGVSAHLRGQEGTPVPVCTVDSFVGEAGLARVDFIKMDIEGLEPRALAGARKTIERFHPRLAICIYHYSEHLYEIFEQIRSFGKPYRFHIKNSQYTEWGTVLFCAPVEKADEPLPAASGADGQEMMLMRHLGKLFLLQTQTPEPAAPRELSTWECGVQLAKNFHLYRILKPVWRRFVKKKHPAA